MITVSSENCIEFFTPIIAAFYIGATVAPVNHSYTQSEMQHALNIAKPQIIFCSKQIYPKFVDLKKRLNFIERILIIDSEDGTRDLRSIEAFIRENLHGNEPLYRFDVADVNLENQIAFILYSSGTTGLPKGVMITQRNVLTKFAHSE